MMPKEAVSFALVHHLEWFGVRLENYRDHAILISPIWDSLVPAVVLYRIRVRQLETIPVAYRVNHHFRTTARIKLAEMIFYCRDVAPEIPGLQADHHNDQASLSPMPPTTQNPLSPARLIETKYEIESKQAQSALLSIARSN